MNFIQSLEIAFAKNSNPENAVAMSKYMRNHFPFFGIKTETRRQIFKEELKKNLNEIQENSRGIALQLFAKPEREFHYCAIEIIIKQLKNNYRIDDIQFIEKLLISNSWWDSVDSISKNILGQYLLEHPLETESVIEKFSNSDAMWLNRSAILFQLGYKHKTNIEILKSECNKHKDSNAFFIQKAIGWALREYGKTDPNLVKTFVSNSNLKPLSKKEALKNIG